MGIRVKTSSPLRYGDFLSVDGAEFWDLLDLPEIPEQADDLRYTVVTTDRVDSLAYRFYKDHRLWWVIALANDLEILPTQLAPGLELRIPAPRYVIHGLLASTSKRVT